MLWLVVVGLVAGAAAWVWWELSGGKWRARYRLPPGPSPVPLLGTLHLMDPERPYQSLRDWAAEFGPVFTMWTGPRPAVVVTDLQLIREAAERAGTELLGRPTSPILDLFSGGPAGIRRSAGQLWAVQRAFVADQLEQLVPEAEKAVLEQVDQSVRFLRAKAGTRDADLLKEFHLIAANVLWRLATGKAWPRDSEGLQRFQAVLRGTREVWELPQAFLFSAFPALCEVGWLRGLLGWGALEERATEFSAFLDQEMEEARSRWEAGGGRDQSCLLHRLFAEQRRRGAETAGESEPFSPAQLRAVLGDLATSGVETVAQTLSWAVLYLLHQPETEERCQRELAETVGRDRRVGLADRPRLPALQRTLDEAQRLANVLPLNGFQSAAGEGVQLAGYDLPPSVPLHLEFSAVLAAATHFPEPERFRPDRFAEGRPPAFCPFSLGRRACPAERLAGAELFLVFANFLQAFRFRPAPGALPPTQPLMGFVLSPQPFSLLIELAN